MPEENPIIQEVYNIIKENEPCYFSAVYIPLYEKYTVHDIFDALWYLQESRRIYHEESTNLYTTIKADA